MDLQALYKNLNVSHLSVDEVEHELLIRKIVFSFHEHESVKRRRLKDRMKQEKNLPTITFTYSPTWKEVANEISIIYSKSSVIKNLLDNPKTDVHQKEKLKTRLIHYRVRTFLLSRAAEARRHQGEIQAISKQIAQTFSKHFPESIHSEDDDSKELDQLETDISRAIEEVRTEIEILNETVSANDVVVEAENLTEEAWGGVKEKSVHTKKQEMESSVTRSEQILEKLSNYEQGNIEIPTDLIKHLKSFVIQTTEQERQYREKEIQMEERMLKEAKENVERKKRLEKLLISLNEQMKCNAQEPILDFPIPLNLETPAKISKK